MVVLTLPQVEEPEAPADARAPLVLAVPRDRPPFAGDWSLPGGLIGPDEGLEAAVSRVLAGLARDSHAQVLAVPRHLEQLETFGAPGRDPRGRVVSVSYLALLRAPVPLTGGAAWLPATAPPPLAFDHAAILAAALERLRSKLSYSTVAYGLLADSFTLSELQAVYEAVLGRTIDKRNFRRKLASLALLEETGGQRRGPHRPASMYRFASGGLVLLDDVIAT